MIITRIISYWTPTVDVVLARIIESKVELLQQVGTLKIYIFYR